MFEYIFFHMLVTKSCVLYIVNRHQQEEFFCIEMAVTSRKSIININISTFVWLHFEKIFLFHDAFRSTSTSRYVL